MELPHLHVFNLGSISQTQEKKQLIVVNNKITLSNEVPELNTLLYNFLKGGTHFQTQFQAKELYNRLTNKIANLGELEIFLGSNDVERFSRVLKELKSLTKSTEIIDRTISALNAEVLSELIIKLEALEEEKQNKLELDSSIDTVFNTITDKIIGILVQEALTRGSFIRLGLAIARLNPQWDIPHECDLTPYLRSRIVTNEFRQCLYESLKGNDPDVAKLDPLQKKFFLMANKTIWLLMNMPDFTVKWLPMIGRFTKLGLSILAIFPVAGPLIVSVCGPIDDVINLSWKNEKEIKLLKIAYNEAKQKNNIDVKKISVFKRMFNFFKFLAPRHSES